MHLLLYNNNIYNPSNTRVLNLSKTTNSLIGDLSNWNIFIKSLLITSLDLPICDLKKFVLNQSTGKMVYSITLYDDNGYNFFINTPSPYIVGVDLDPNTPNTYKGVCVSLKFVSERNTDLNDNSYYKLHYVSNFLNMVNVAIRSGLELHTSPTINSALCFLSFIPGQPYILQMDIPLYSSTVSLYFGSMLKPILDGFNVSYNKSETDVTSPNYTGMNWIFNKSNTYNNQVITTQPARDYYNFQAEFITISSLSTYIGIAILCNGSLTSVRDTVYDYFDSSSASINLSTKKILKVLDFQIDGLNSIQGNNYLQYESIISSDSPINCMNNQSLINVELQFYLISNDGTFSEILLPVNACLKLQLIFKRK
jgi:hypothetical protein